MFLIYFEFWEIRYFITDPCLLLLFLTVTHESDLIPIFNQNIPVIHDQTLYNRPLQATIDITFCLNQQPPTPP